MPAYSARQTLVGTAIVGVALLAAVLATVYPLPVVGLAVGAVVARRVVQVAVRIRRERRRTGRTRVFCIPKTGVCVEA